MQIRSTEEKFLYELAAIYNAETRFLEAQQHMIRQTHNERLSPMLLHHIDETQQQIKNLQLVFSLIDRPPQSIDCEAATGLIHDAQALMQQTAIHPDLLDTVIVETQIKMKHFAIVGYRGLMKGIEQLGQTIAASLLGENLRQEEQTLQVFEDYFYAMPNSGTRMRPL